MDLSKIQTTRQPITGHIGGVRTLQRNVTIYVLVAGIAGGLLLVFMVFLLCKYCSSTPHGATDYSANYSSQSVNKTKSQPPAKADKATSSSFHLVAMNSESKDQECSRTTFSRTGQEGITKTHKSNKHSCTTTATTSAAAPSAANLSIPLNPHMDSKDVRTVDNECCVIQVEPIRVIPSTPIGNPWTSVNTAATESRDHALMLPINNDIDSWSTRRSLSAQSSVGYRIRSNPINNAAISSKSTSSSSTTMASSCEVTFKRSLRHAASHPESSVSKRRLDWRNSHRNYRSTPNSSGSRTKTNPVSYEARTALRDYLSVEQQRSPSSRSSTLRQSDRSLELEPANRKFVLTKAGSMREYECKKEERHHRDSPTMKRWRCHTVDCDCSLPVKELQSNLTIHRHSFPTDENKVDHRQHKNSSPGKSVEDATRRSYNNSLNRSESLDWPAFRPKDVESDEHGSAPRINIRYNDPGSLESVNEDTLVFCFEAGSKNEFRQRLEKTIHAQYRQVWELRATLEERSDFSDIPSSPEPDNRSLEMPVCNNTSFGSSMEGIDKEPTCSQVFLAQIEHHSAGKSTSSNLLCPSSALKRQSYRNAVESRICRANSASNVPSSFDSIDTIETSASSTDASRLDQVTTSFESSATADTTTTDSTTAEMNSFGSNSAHRLISSSRGDSGYKSLEVNPARRNPRLTKSAATADSIDEDDDDDDSCIESSHNTNRLTADVNQCQCQSDQHDDKCERNKPIIFARCTRYGLAKSRSTASNQKFTWKNRLVPVLNRDYSIDERADALFREFSRCDPIYEKNTSRRDDARNAGFNKRWHQRMFSLQNDVTTATDSSDHLLDYSLKE